MIRLSHALSAALFGLSLSACCLGAGSSPPSTAVAPITIGPGFAPQPLTAVGRLDQGFVNALDFAPTCRGMLPGEPQHVLEVTSAIPALSVVVRAAQGDPTLVIRGPGGRILCSDDSEGLNPGVRDAFGPGRYEIFVGDYARSPQPTYRLGLAETELRPSQLPPP